MEDLIKKVREWSIYRGLNTADQFKQLIKLREEYGELNSGIAKGDNDLIKDSIGDTMVVLIILGQITGNDYVIDNMFASPNFELDKTMTNQRKLLTLFDYSFGNLSMNILYDKQTKYDFEDCVIILYNIAIELNTTLSECLQLAYNEIKDRKGKMVDGVWVKEEDLKKTSTIKRETFFGFSDNTFLYDELVCFMNENNIKKNDVISVIEKSNEITLIYEERLKG